MKPKFLFAPRHSTRAASAFPPAFVSLASVLTLAFSTQAHAASATWNGTTSATWATAGNWTAGGPPGTGDTATFNNAGGASDVISASGVTVKTITFSGTPDAYTIGSGAVGSQSLTLETSITLTSGITTNQVINANVALGGSATITNSDADNTLTIAGVISGGQTLAKNGAGLVILSGANTYTGATTVGTGGTLRLDNNLALQNSAIATAGAGTYTLGSGITTPTIGGLTGSKALASVFANYANATTLTLNPQTNSSVTYSGDLVNGATGMNLIKTGAGTQTLSGTNTYSGNTTVTAGNLITTKAASLAGYTTSGKVAFNGGNLGVQVGGAGWTTAEVDTLLTNATKTSGSLGIDTTNGDVTQWTAFTTTNFGGLGLTKLGANTLTLNALSTTAASNYSGTTILNGGTLAITADASFTGGLTFGSALGSGSLSTLNLNSASATFGGTMLVQTNGSNNTITIGAEKKLTINGNVSFGGTTGGTFSSQLAVSGSGGWDVVSSNGTFAGFGGAGGGNQQIQIDMSGLATFNANLRTGGTGSDGGLFRTSKDNGASNNARANNIILATNSTISSEIVEVTAADQTGTSRLALGSGIQIINSDDIKIGSRVRDNATFNFNTADGTLKIRGTVGDEDSRGNLAMGLSGISGGGNKNQLFDVTAHQADLRFNEVKILNSANPDDGTSIVNATFAFDRGTLDATNFQIGIKATGTLQATLQGVANIGSAASLINTSTFGAVSMGALSTNAATANGLLTSTLNITGTATTVNFGTMSMANSTSTDVDAEIISAVNISGGNTTGTSGIDMATALAAGTGISTLTISGGSLSVGNGGVSAASGIYRTATSANATTTLRLNGGSLDLNGNSIGGAGANAITTQFESGTLRNVGQINGGTGLTKATAGTLTLTGTNTYTGATAVNGGALIVNGSIGNTAVTVAAGTLTAAPVAKLGGTGTIGGAVSLTAEFASGFKNGGVLAPTAAASGTALDVTGTTTFNTGSLFDWNMSATAPATDPGEVTNSGSYGQLAGTGAITGSGAVFSIVLGAGNAFSDNFWNSTKTWDNVFTGAGATTNLASIFGSFGGVGVDSDGVVSGRGTFSFTGTGTLTFTAVPEPTSALAGLLLTAGLLRRRRNVGS